MAKLELLPRKEFKITLDSGDIITGKFGTWALKRFCQKRNYLLSDVTGKMSSPEIDDVTELILCAVEQSHRESKSKEPFIFNDVDTCSWIDELGGFSSADFIRLFGHAGDAEPEKKSDQQPALS